MRKAEWDTENRWNGITSREDKERGYIGAARDRKDKAKHDEEK